MFNYSIKYFFPTYVYLSCVNTMHSQYLAPKNKCSYPRLIFLIKRPFIEIHVPTCVLNLMVTAKKNVQVNNFPQCTVGANSLLVYLIMAWQELKCLGILSHVVRTSVYKLMYTCPNIYHNTYRCLGFYFQIIHLFFPGV